MFLDLKTGDRGCGGGHEMASGLWPRFSRYEIREKDGRQFICPEVNAELESYDPWAAPQQFDLGCVDNIQSADNTETRPPYIHFLSFLDDLKMNNFDNQELGKKWATTEFRLTPDQMKTLCDWCARNGLLGILFHEVKMFRLPYIDHQPEGNMYRSIAYYKKQGEWFLNDFHFKTKQQNSQKSLSASFSDWKAGRVELESYSSSSLFADSEDPFYGSDPQWIADNYFPFSDNISETMTRGEWQDVWVDYCEPVDFFLDKAAMLARSLWLLARHDRTDWYEMGVTGLSKLIGEAPVCYGFVNGKVAPKFRAPSLLSAYSLMALDEAADGARFLQCENEKCGRWFTSKRIKAKFCRPRCNTAQQQRKRRRRIKEVENPREGQVRTCRECGAAMDEKRPQAKFCTTTCGNTFRKRAQRAKKAEMV